MPEAWLRAARPGEAAALSSLALRSKGHWGYSEEFLEACRTELTVPESSIDEVEVAEVDGVLVGFSWLRRGSDGAAVLEMLFVDPPWIGHGLGGRLLASALASARAAGVDDVTLDADPDAEPFYLRHGARRVGEVASGSVPGRVLPRLEFVVDPGMRQPPGCFH